MSTRKPQILYQSTLGTKLVTLTFKNGVYELRLLDTGRDTLADISVALVDPGYSNPIQHARRT